MIHFRKHVTGRIDNVIVAIAYIGNRAGMQNRDKMALDIFEEGVVRIDHVDRVIIEDRPRIGFGNNVLYRKCIALVADFVVGGQHGADIAEHLL